METPGTYPKRESYFFAHFLRLVTQSEIAQEIGPGTIALLTAVVVMEDTRNYASPVTFYNSQLQRQCGFSSENTLAGHRKRAIDAGLLHYEPGGKGCPGVYWVMIPTPTAAVDTHPIPSVTPDLSLKKCGAIGGKVEGQTGDKRRPSYPSPDPNPKPINTSLPSKPLLPPRTARPGRSGRGFDGKDLKDGGKILAYAKGQGIDTTRHELRIRCLSAAMEAVKGDRPGGLFVLLISKGSGGDWSTIPDEHHEHAKQWLKRLETPSFCRPPPLFDDDLRPSVPISEAVGTLLSSMGGQ